ncbi:hypothetical protein [Robiginitalea sediminis]|uniref:hypothetical protein n=1 Tax=Robiginitalea sediminis TaxID=1982593 RepID=UPI000B4BCDFE|nr:hypothetical protein [Robiginitalea sediminis]
MDLSSFTTLHWVLLLLVGIVCLIIGYFWGRSGDKSAGIASELEREKEKAGRLEKDLETCRGRLSEAESEVEASHEIPFDANAAKAAFGKRIKENDLKIVEGIGPKIEGLFHNYDIRTWKALSDTPVSKCQAVLDSGGDRFKVHDPSSWPMQARMAYEGKWADLVRWQDEHNHGKL